MKMTKWLDVEKRVVTKDHKRKKGSSFFIRSIWIVKEYKQKPSSVHSVLSDSLQPQGLQHARRPCLSQTPGTYSNSCPSRQWCYPTISSSIISFSSCLQFFPASGSFPVSQFFASGGQSIGVSISASILSMNIQHWFPLGLTGCISLQSRDSQESPTSQFKSINSLELSFFL